MKGLIRVKKNVLILSSSPRPDGNSRALCDALAEGARFAGHDAHVLDVAQLSIRPCLGCNYCYNHSNACAIHDDMDLVWAEIDKADILVFASPIYFFNVSAQLKLVIDRLYARYRTMHPTESALLLTSADSESVTRPVRMAYQKMVECCSFTDRGVICASRVWETGDIQNHPALKTAFDLGSSF